MTKNLDYIFLNLEGVLNNVQSSKSEFDYRKTYEEESIQVLESILRENENAEIVCLSTWFDATYLEYLKWFMGNYSSLIANRMMYMCHDTMKVTRGVTIENWLKSNKQAKKRFIVIDSVDDHHHINQHCYKIDKEIGLKQNDYLQIKNLISTQMQKKRFFDFI